MLVKIHNAYRQVVAICDSELIDKKFEDKDGKRVIDLTGSFFKGDEKTADEVKEIIEDAVREDACFNIVGKESVSLCREVGLIKDEGIKKIQDVPVALVLL